MITLTDFANIVPSDKLNAKCEELHNWTNNWSAGTVYVYAITYKGHFQCLGYGSKIEQATMDYNYNTKKFVPVDEANGWKKIHVATLTQDNGLKVALG